MPVLLALDTATDRVHAALAAQGQVRVLDVAGSAQASATLLPGLVALLEEAGLNWAAVDAIGFGSGPGAFTGLRTACATAQGLALGLNKPVIAIDTLMAVAEDARASVPQAVGEGDTLWVMQDARMDELYVAAFAWRAGLWHGVQSPQLWPAAEPAARWATGIPGASEGAAPHAVTALPPRLLAGSGLLAYPALLDGLAAAHRWPQAAPRGPALMTLMQQAWQRGDTLDPALALPRYVRDKVAQTTAERAAEKAAAPQAAHVPGAMP